MILNAFTPAHQRFSVIDMANDFWSVPHTPKVHPWFVLRLTWTPLPLGFHNTLMFFSHGSTKPFAETACYALGGYSVSGQYLIDLGNKITT